MAPPRSTHDVGALEKVIYPALGMVGQIIFFVVMWAVTAFLANRLYVIIRYQAITVKGVTYSKRDTPIMYWIEMIIILAGLIMIGGIAVVLTLGSIGLLD